MSTNAVQMRGNAAVLLSSGAAALTNDDGLCCCDGTPPPTQYYPLLFCEDGTDSGKRFPSDWSVSGEPVADHLADVYRENTTGFCYTLGALVDDAGVSPGAGKFIATCEECCDCDRSVLPSTLTVVATVTGRGAGGPDTAVVPLDATDCEYGTITNSIGLVFQAQLLGPGSPADLGYGLATTPCGYVLNILSTVQEDGFPPCEFQMFMPGVPPYGAFTGTNLIANPGTPCHTAAVSSVSGTVS